MQKLRSFLGSLHRLVLFAPVRATLGFFWVGGAIGLGAGVAGLLPEGAKVVKPLCLAIGALIGYCSFVRIVERRPVRELICLGWFGELAGGLSIGLFLFGVVIGTLFLLGVYSIDGVHPWSVVIPAFTTAVMAGVTEELLIRAIAFRILEEWLGSWIALAVTAILFGAMHLGNPQATAVSAAAIALEAGVMLAAAYMVTRRIWLAIGIHVAWNFAQGGIFGVATSGVESAGYLQGRLQGPEILSGGSFGPEASIVAVVVCVAAGLYMLRSSHNKQRFLKPSWRRGKSSAAPTTSSDFLAGSVNKSDQVS
jgi:uncharacterized protein